MVRLPFRQLCWGQNTASFINAVKPTARLCVVVVSILSASCTRARWNTSTLPYLQYALKHAVSHTLYYPFKTHPITCRRLTHPFHTLYPTSDTPQMEGCVGGPCRDAPPRNTCEAHPLCSQVLCTGELCCNPAAPPHMYCAAHAAILYTSGGDEMNKGGRGRKVGEKEKQPLPGQCCGIKTGKDKSRCKTKQGTVLLGGLSWCDAHRDQYVPGIELTHSPAAAAAVVVAQSERGGLLASSSAPVSLFERGDTTDLLYYTSPRYNTVQPTP